MIRNEIRKYFGYKLMSEFMIYLCFVHSLFWSVFALTFICHGDLLFSLA